MTAIELARAHGEIDALRSEREALLRRVDTLIEQAVEMEDRLEKAEARVVALDARLMEATR